MKNQKNDIFSLIEKEKKRDIIIKRISNVAWGLTLLVLFLFLIFTVVEFLNVYKRYLDGFVQSQQVIDTLTPFMLTFGTITLIVAILTTIGMFLRLRTTNLLEIQQRLTSLEGMLGND